MSYKAAVKMKPVLVYITMSADQTMASSDTLLFDTITGSTGHSVTISSGVVTVPSGHQWFCQVQALSSNIVTVDLDWYINSSVSTLFANTGITQTTLATATGNSVAHCALDAISSTVDVELRANGAVTIESDFAFMTLIGYPS